VVVGLRYFFSLVTAEACVDAIHDATKHAVVYVSEPFDQLIAFNRLQAVSLGHSKLDKRTKRCRWVDDNFVRAGASVSESAQGHDQDVPVAEIAVVPVSRHDNRRTALCVDAGRLAEIHDPNVTLVYVVSGHERL